MPRTEVVFFQNDDGSVPLLEWLDDQPEKAQNKCIVRIERLEEMGHELRRPEADFFEGCNLRVEGRPSRYELSDAVLFRSENRSY